MQFERFSLTMAPGGENHVGGQFLGVDPKETKGLSVSQIKKLRSFFSENYKVEYLDLGKEAGLGEEFHNKAAVLIVREYVNLKKTQDIYEELIEDKWDAFFYSTRAKTVQNKRARHNLCYQRGKSQEPDYPERKGRIVDLTSKSTLCKVVDKIESSVQCQLGKDKYFIKVVEGNRYYNLKTCGIGFHGDTERKVVTCLTIGCDDFPMTWKWFQYCKVIGDSVNIKINNGDLYFMSEKAVGTDWKQRNIPTIRHAAGTKYVK